MRLNAYLLAADPAWIEASVLSYYDLVDRIVVSYDQDGRGWTGVPIEAAECLGRLRAIDRAGKLDFRPGHFGRPAFHERPMENETHQRQVALDQASEGADWVLQFDTDEIIPELDTFLACVADAHAANAGALDYPQRWLYRQLGRGRYLEASSRFWRKRAGYPGPIAVRRDTRLTRARQADVTKFRVDIGPRNTDPWHPKDAPVHRVINSEEAILHFSMVRDEAALGRKTTAWGHAKDRDWTPELRRWAWAGRHPWLTALSSPFNVGRLGHTHRPHLRISKIPTPKACLHAASLVEIDQAWMGLC